MTDLRILDVGCHDGYVSNWLGRQLKESGLTVHIDGVELNPQAVGQARERAARDGLPGEYKVGLAEHAPDLFEPGSYDAVIAFEIIEHVPQVGALLAACEQMLKPGGRVYLSTPDGTFGAGQNPHHLRVYRAVDLFDLLRRRGLVTDLIAGADGVAAASYTPAAQPPRGEVAIYCGPGWQQWSPTDIETKGLGGSETAATRLATALGRLGYIVTVYAECTFEAHVDGVLFCPFQTFDPLEPRDLVVVSRAPALFDHPINAALKVLWMHDTDYGAELTAERAVQADRVLVLSDWHAAHVRDVYPFMDQSNLLSFRNGIEPSYFRPNEAPQTGDRAQRAIYSSSPDRGLDLLLELWPDVRSAVPEAELVYCYSQVYDAVAGKVPHIKAFRDRIAKLTAQPGVVNLGSLSQPDLASAMSTCRAWLAPSYSTPAGARFHETFCIGAVEAAAAGCELVMSNWGALPERADQANRWQLIDGGMAEPIPTHKWVDAIISALTNDEDVGPSKVALQYDWDEPARILRDLLDGVDRRPREYAIPTG